MKTLLLSLHSGQVRSRRRSSMHTTVRERSAMTSKLLHMLYTAFPGSFLSDAAISSQRLLNNVDTCLQCVPPVNQDPFHLSGKSLIRGARIPVSTRLQWSPRHASNSFLWSAGHISQPHMGLWPLQTYQRVCGRGCSTQVSNIYCVSTFHLGSHEYRQLVRPICLKMDHVL